MNCPYCGEKIEPPNLKVCPFCRTKLDIPSEDSQPKQDYNLADLMQMVTAHSAQEPYQSDRYYSSSHELLSKEIQPHATNLKTSFAFSLTSFLIPTILVIIGIPLVYHIFSSIIQEQNWLALLLYLSDPDFQDRTLFPTPQYTLSEDLKMMADIVGIMFVMLSIAGMILGIISKKMRNKSNKLNIAFSRIGNIFSMLGIISSIIGMIIGGILLYVPYYLVRLNIYSPFM